HRRINAAGQSQQNLAGSNLRANTLDGVFDDVADAPQRVAPGDLPNEALEDARALNRVSDLGMELDAVELALLVTHGGKRNRVRRSDGDKALGQLCNPVAMTHPHIEHRAAVAVVPIVNSIQQTGGPGDRDLRIAEFALCGGSHTPAELLRHRLHAVADAEHRHPESENRFGSLRRTGVGDGFGAAGKNDSARLEGA